MHNGRVGRLTSKQRDGGRVNDIGGLVRARNGSDTEFAKANAYRMRPADWH